MNTNKPNNYGHRIDIDLADALAAMGFVSDGELMEGDAGSAGPPTELVQPGPTRSFGRDATGFPSSEWAEDDIALTVREVLVQAESHLAGPEAAHVAEANCIFAQITLGISKVEFRLESLGPLRASCIREPPPHHLASNPDTAMFLSDELGPDQTISPLLLRVPPFSTLKMGR
jgi:hypothetical protein